MLKKCQEFLKNSKNITKDNKFFWAREAWKYQDKNDEYIYDVFEETKETANLCNAMALVHCKNSYVIFQKENDIREAEKTIVEKGIYRIEDYR